MIKRIKKDGKTLPEHKLTTENFYMFVEMFRRFQELFCLNNWEVRFHFIQDDPGANARASVQVADLGNHLAVVRVYPDWDVFPTDQMLWRTAFHEVLELLLGEMNCLAELRTWNYDEYDREGHRVIRTLEKVVFDKMWGAKDGIFDIFQSSAKGNKRPGRRISGNNKK